MPLVPSIEMVARASEEGYAVPAFNAENMEMVQAIVDAAAEASSPVMIQTTPTTVKYLGLDMAVGMVTAMAKPASVPVALHLDHSEDFDSVMRAVKAGYTSLMFDGSKKSYAENRDASTAVARVATAMGISVEAELGTLGGKEDDLVAERPIYTDPAQAADFVAHTKVDMLAVAIGTAHGFYKGVPKLNFDLLKEIRKRVNIPLVLHGASGLADDVVQTAISLGMAKVNFATELRFVFTEAARSVLKDEEVFDPKKYLAKGRDAVKTLCLKKIAVCGSGGKA